MQTRVQDTVIRTSTLPCLTRIAWYVSVSSPKPSTCIIHQYSTSNKFFTSFQNSVENTTMFCNVTVTEPRRRRGALLIFRAENVRPSRSKKLNEWHHLAKVVPLCSAGVCKVARLYYVELSAGLSPYHHQLASPFPARRCPPYTSTPSKKSASAGEVGKRKGRRRSRAVDDVKRTQRERATTISPRNRGLRGRRRKRRRSGGTGEKGVFATVKADRSAGHSNTEFPVWHFTKPFEQDGA